MGWRRAVVDCRVSFSVAACLFYGVLLFCICIFGFGFGLRFGLCQVWFQLQFQFQYGTGILVYWCPGRMGKGTGYIPVGRFDCLESRIWIGMTVRVGMGYWYVFF